MSLTVLWLSMRTVTDIGGSCGSGGPYENARPCPGNVAGLHRSGTLDDLEYAKAKDRVIREENA
jgi:hypothetical protein